MRLIILDLSDTKERVGFSAIISPFLLWSDAVKSEFSCACKSDCKDTYANMKITQHKTKQKRNGKRVKRKCFSIRSICFITCCHRNIGVRNMNT